MKMRYEKGGRKPDFLDLDKDGNRTEPMVNAYMGGGKYYKMGGEYGHGGKHDMMGGAYGHGGKHDMMSGAYGHGGKYYMMGGEYEHGGRKNDFLVRDAERLRDRNPGAYTIIAQDVMDMLIRNNQADAMGDEVIYDPLRLNPELVQDYLNTRARKRKKSLGRILKGLGAGVATGYLASDADTEGFYREGTKTQYEGSLPQYATRREIKLGTGETMNPSLGNEGAFMFESQPGNLPYQAVTTPTDREVGQMSNLMLLLGRLAGDIYKGRRYE